MGTTSLSGAGRSGRPRNPEVEQVVLRATTDLIGRNGYAATTLDEIAAAAGVAKTTLYRRWSTKPDLVVAALVEAVGTPPGPESGREKGLGVAIGWLATRIADPRVHQLLVGLLAEAGRNPALRADLRLRIREPFGVRAVQSWGVDPAAVDLAFDVVVGTILHRSTMAGPIPGDVLDKITAIAESLLF
jgi:AcrR family transcriptional regulator